MRGRPPKKDLSPEQAHAADAFIRGAEADAAPDPPAAPDAPRAAREDDAPRPVAEESRTRRRRRAEARRARQAAGGATERFPWEAPRVREDVTKGYALRLPEPLYLKLKYVSKQTGTSMNQLCNEAVARLVEEELAYLTDA
jgi:hypothetical protein